MVAVVVGKGNGLDRQTHFLTGRPIFLFVCRLVRIHPQKVHLFINVEVSEGEATFNHFNIKVKMNNYDGFKIQSTCMFRSKFAKKHRPENNILA